jgi:hypothetical protein
MILFLSKKTRHILALFGAGVVTVIYISLNWVGFIDDAYIFFVMPTTSVRGTDMFLTSANLLKVLPA